MSSGFNRTALCITKVNMVNNYHPTEKFVVSLYLHFTQIIRTQLNSISPHIY